MFSRDKRIVNGINSTIEEYPYLAALELFGDQLCGGAIISAHHILTAAHCFDNSKNPYLYVVRVGSSLREDDGILLQVRDFAIHDGYNNDINDLAIVLLKDPIEFDNVTKSSIAMFDFKEESVSGSIATLAGWGRLGWNATKSKQLHRIKFNIINKRTCNNIRVEAGDGIHEGEICASDFTGSQSACFGDSGGPLVIKGRLAGIATEASGCSTWPAPNVFSEVAYYRKWIDGKILELHA